MQSLTKAAGRTILPWPSLKPDSIHLFLPADYLSGFVSDITSALKAYEVAEDQQAKTQALERVAQSSRKLNNASTNPSEAFSDFVFQPLGLACVRIAISIGVFEELAKADGDGLSINEIAKATGSEEALLVRVIRALVALDMVEEKTKGRFRNTQLSKAYTDPSRKAWAVWMWDVMANVSTGLGPYFDENGFHNPADPKTSPFLWTKNATGRDVFETVKEMGKLQLFNDAMAGSSILCAQDAVSTYDFGKLAPGEDDVLIVDVGGSKGQTLKEIKAAYPTLKGRMILQDLKFVLDGGCVPGLDAEAQEYDFFKQVQPVKGAAAYLYQRIFHDWSDENCRLILRNLRPAMGRDSKLLISDVVVPDHQPHRRKTMRDMNMLLVGGMERSPTQWQQLLEDEGFTIQEVHGIQNPNNSIVEARLLDR